MGVISVSGFIFFYFDHINICYLYYTESTLISPESRDAKRSKNS
jgi:hypothetical protein